MIFRGITGLGVALAVVAAACSRREEPVVHETQTLDPDRVAEKLKERSIHPEIRVEGSPDAFLKVARWNPGDRVTSPALKLEHFAWHQEGIALSNGYRIGDSLAFVLRVKDGVGDGAWAQCVLEMKREYDPGTTDLPWRGGVHGEDRYYCLKPATSEPAHSMKQMVEGVGNLLGLTPHPRMPMESRRGTKGPVDF